MSAALYISWVYSSIVHIYLIITVPISLTLELSRLGRAAAVSLTSLEAKTAGLPLNISGAPCFSRRQVVTFLFLDGLDVDELVHQEVGEIGINPNNLNIGQWVGKRN